MKDILDAVESSQHCQRNWDLTKDIDPDHIKIFESIVKTVPSKQNIAYYKVHFITNRTIIEKIYMRSMTKKDNSDIDFYNPQILANLLVAFEEYWDIYSDARGQAIAERNIKNERYNDFTAHVDIHQSIGIASGVLAFTANYLGYKTGFCKCFDENEVKDILKADKKIKLLLGIGYPKKYIPHTQHHIWTNHLLKPLPKTEIPIIKLP